MDNDCVVANFICIEDVVDDDDTCFVVVERFFSIEVEVVKDCFLVEENRCDDVSTGVDTVGDDESEMIIMTCDELSIFNGDWKVNDSTSE